MQSQKKHPKKTVLSHLCHSRLQMLKDYFSNKILEPHVDTKITEIIQSAYYGTTWQEL